MARSRNIKPGFFVNDELAECPPLARLMFIGLWTLADAEGRLKDLPRRIKAQTLPYDECDPDSLLINLDKSGFIQRYTVQGQPTIQVVNFVKHQNPHINERKKGSALGAFEDRDNKTIENQEVKRKSRLIQINPDESDTNREDSLLLNDDSLNPDSLIPDHETLTMKEESNMSGILKDETKNILDYLNNKTGKRFKPVPTNLNLIKARLKDGHSVDEILRVIDAKYVEWKDDSKMAIYLRPETLFRDRKFNQYVGELGVETPSQRNARELDEWANTIDGEIADD